ncbi:MAG: 4-hydroxy-tetrahydrodipicolinate reductase [Betaproteobacteria bacterium AqS2]|uniref:4-hydroxy-tetrahydrodipicolinate reductase n=1 Tax=Candidatus Amphirhobacter heronislandensis TaxID=1732024 RepID=A0A930UGB1_9GAMM|nr:4-hydroxy-tetrahydrodipicolinate reductase [Betaproteobacteria bacterium AqS2]
MAGGPVRIGVWGAAGRMGIAIAQAIADEPGAELAAAFEHDGHPLLGEQMPGRHRGVRLQAASAPAPDFEVLVAFPIPEGLAPAIALARQRKIALVVGTTGYSDEDHRALAAAAEEIPLLVEPNMSLGVVVVNILLQQAVHVLPNWDAEVHEIHHAEKKDAPSGTAKLLVDSIRDARSKSKVLAGQNLQIDPDKIGVTSGRAGDIVGVHTALLANRGECIELTHRAFDRATFAGGAVFSAVRIARQPAGRYRLAELLLGGGG